MSTLKPFCIDDLPLIKGVGSPVLSPDGKSLVYTVGEMLAKENGYRTCLWLWHDGVARQLTNNTSPTTRDGSPQWSPCGTKIAFSSGRGGNSQVWLIDLKGGEALQLTRAPLGVMSFKWAPDGKSIFYLAKDKKELPKGREGHTARHITLLRYKFNGVGYFDTFFEHIYQQKLDGSAVIQLTHGDRDASDPIISPDGKKIAFVVRRGEETSLDRDIWLLDIESGEQVNLTEGKAIVSNVFWKQDSSSLYFLGHTQGRIPGYYPELRELKLSDKTIGKVEVKYHGFLGGSLPGADVRYDGGSTSPSLTPCGKGLYFVGSEGGSSYLYYADLATGEVKHIFGEGQQVITSYSVKQNTIVVNLATPTTVDDLWISAESQPFVQITDINSELFAKRWMSFPEVIHFTHPDGQELEGWIMKPYGYEEGKQYPLVMEIHGGPNVAYGNVFFHEFQVLAGMGIGVLYTNPRGSMGYGSDFATVIIGDWCGIDARDLQFMAEEAAKLPWVNSQKVGVTGGSQGGYFTNWLIGHTEMFAAAVSQRSMSNLYTKYGTADNGWNGDKFGMGGVDLWDNEELLMERSPIRYAHKVKTPLLLLHSDMDFRCPLEQAEQFYVAVKRNGTPAELVIFAGENHELSRGGKPINRLTRLDHLTGWFNKYLLN